MCKARPFVTDKMHHGNLYQWPLCETGVAWQHWQLWEDSRGPCSSCFRAADTTTMLARPTHPHRPDRLSTTRAQQLSQCLRSRCLCQVVPGAAAVGEMQHLSTQNGKANGKRHSLSADSRLEQRACLMQELPSLTWQASAQGVPELINIDQKQSACKYHC